MPNQDNTYQRLFESANAAILIISADFIIIDCNEMAAKLLDRPKDEILGTTPDDPTISPEFQANGKSSSELGREYFGSAMEGNDLRFEWLHLKRDGTEFPVEVSLFGFIASNRTNFFAMWRDLTEVNRYQQHLEELVHERTEELEETLEALKRTQSQLVQSEKMASLGVMTSGIAHEINNPLNYILGSYTGLKQLLADKNINDEKIDRLLEYLNTGVDRAANIVKGLTQLSGNQDRLDEACEIHTIIDNCLIMLENQMEGRIEIRKEFSNESLVIPGNTGRLHQVFMNILMNSIQSIENSGTISIATKQTEGMIRIVVSDTGCGIEKENLTKIIDPFFTTRDPGEGTGLGLSITYNIIKEHGGGLEFESAPDVGTIARITLPLNS